MVLKSTIKENQQRFTYTTIESWGDVDDASNILETKYYEVFNKDITRENKTSSNDIFHYDYEKYDEYNIDADLKHFQNIKKNKNII